MRCASALTALSSPTTAAASLTACSLPPAPLPAIADAVKGDITILADSGIRNGLDVVRMIAPGADSVLLGRAYLYALATHGKQGVANLLNLIEKEMKVAMTLTGAKSISEISRDSLVQNAEALQTFDALKQGQCRVIPRVFPYAAPLPQGEGPVRLESVFLLLPLGEGRGEGSTNICYSAPPQLRGQYAEHRVIRTRNPAEHRQYHPPVRQHRLQFTYH